MHSRGRDCGNERGDRIENGHGRLILRINKSVEAYVITMAFNGMAKVDVMTWSAMDIAVGVFGLSQLSKLITKYSLE